eukprot:5827841-Karenia_brevis.AAC.1
MRPFVFMLCNIFLGALLCNPLQTASNNDWNCLKSGVHSMPDQWHVSMEAENIRGVMKSGPSKDGALTGP